jgi:hypothetical protein
MSSLSLDIWLCAKLGLQLLLHHSLRKSSQSENQDDIDLSLQIISALIFYHQVLFWPKWRAFSIACVIGCLMEAGGRWKSNNRVAQHVNIFSSGYVGRLLLHNDPFSDFGFKLNVTLLTVAPAFISAAIYLILKRIITTFGQGLARFRPSLYVWFFVGADIVSIILQGAGGAISAVAQEKAVLDQGVHLMVAGLISQVLTLTIYSGLVVDYFIRCKQNVHRLNPGSLKLVTSRRFQLFVAAVAITFVCIYTRCCYRMAELWVSTLSTALPTTPDWVVIGRMGQ